MPNNDRQHFEDYREQTSVKHAILAAYLPAYFHILKGTNKNLVFIDGFAGRGSYTQSETGERFDGSPLLALKLIASRKDFAQKVLAIFVESDQELFSPLSNAIADFHRKNDGILKPVCINGTFAECVTEIVEDVGGNIAPTFLFVDPCGVTGASFDTISKVMKSGSCEAFIFFNIDGVRRIAGLPQLSDVLVDLMGSRPRAKSLYEGLQKTDTVAAREKLILSQYRQALAEGMGAKFTIAFRVEHEEKQKSSHYLIHATKHHLGFKIMKDVMWGRGRTEYNDGGLEFAQASRTNYEPLFDMSSDDINEKILAALASGPKKVSLFCDEWVCRPDDDYCATAYKAALLKLEADRNIEVLSKDAKDLVPANKRKKWKNKPTLGDDYFVRLAERKSK